MLWNGVRVCVFLFCFVLRFFFFLWSTPLERNTSVYIGHVRRSRNNAVTLWRSVSVAESDSQSPRVGRLAAAALVVVAAVLAWLKPTGVGPCRRKKKKRSTRKDGDDGAQR